MVGFALSNFESVRRAGGNGFNLDVDDQSRRRSIVLKVHDECVDRFLGTFDVNLDARVAVQDPSVEPMRARQPKHKRPEPDALDDTTNVNLPREPAGFSTGRHCILTGMR
jgi:hypothetical protein